MRTRSRTVDSLFLLFVLGACVQAAAQEGPANCCKLIENENSVIKGGTGTVISRLDARKLGRLK